MTQPDRPTEDVEELGEAIAKAFSMPETYKLVIFGDGSGHIENRFNDRGISWVSWDDFSRKVNAPKFSLNQEVLILEGNGKGETGKIKKLDTDGTCLVEYGNGLTTWKSYVNIKPALKFKVKDNVTVNAPTVYVDEVGIIVEIDEDDNFIVWLPCHAVETFTASELTKA